MQAIRLKGKLGAKEEPYLRFDEDGLWLVDALDEPEVRIEVLAARPLMYEERTLGDRLTVGEHQLGVPAGRGGEVTRLISVARLGAGAGRAEATWEVLAPFVEEPSERESVWLARWLAGDESLLALLATGTAVEVASEIGQTAKVDQRFVLTDRRAALVAVGALGDVRVAELPREPLEIEREIGRDRVACGAERWLTSRSNEEAYVALAAVVGLEGGERVRRFAHACWAAGKGRGKLAERARQLLEQTEDAWSALTRTVLAGEPAQDAVLGGIAGDPEASERIVAWAGRWEVSDDVLEAMLTRLRELEHYRAAGAVHEVLWSRRVAASRDPLRGAAHDLEHASALVYAERREEAVGVLEGGLARLPRSELLELVSDGSDEPGSAHALRVAMLEQLAVLRGRDENPDPATLAELVQLTPLSMERLERLGAHAEPALAERVARTLAALAPGGLREPCTDPLEEGTPAPLGEEELMEVLRHPEARGSGALGRLQALIAEVEVPDHGSLRSYCERLHDKAHPEAHRAMTRAVLTLGTRGVEAYVSRGDKTVGVRAYEGEPSFLLIGADNLDPESPYQLSPAELAFAIGSEVAHLRYGHARVTSSDVWRGALDKGRGTLELLLGVMPALQAFRLTSRIGSMAERLGDGPIASVLDHAGRFLPKRESSAGASLDHGTEQLVAAHRVTQFTADRAGLLLAGSLRAALRAIFLSRAVYRAELAAVHEWGLPAALLRKGADGELHHADLAVRCGALIAFYLSDDYRRLSER